eukprot:145664_1
MGSCFGRNRDQDDHQIENEDLLENGIDLESQEVVKPPTQSPPKHGSLSSLVPSKQIVLAVIGALLLLGVTIGGYSRYKKRAKRQQQFLHNLPFDMTGAPLDTIKDGIRDARNIISDIHSDVGVGPQSSFPTKSRRPRAHHHNDSKQIQSTSAMGTGQFARIRGPLINDSSDTDGDGGDVTRGPQRSFAATQPQRRTRHYDHSGAHPVRPTSPMGTDHPPSFAPQMQTRRRTQSIMPQMGMDP